jgi:hypothetical protein
MTGGAGGRPEPPSLASHPLPTPSQEQAPPERPARRQSLGRLFWIGAATILIAAALVAIGAILKGEFSDTDGKICGTLGSLLLCGALAVSGLSLVERRLVPAFGWASVGVAGVSLVLLVAVIWQEFDDETLSRWAGTALVLTVACLLVATSLLLLRGPALLVLVAGEALALAIASLIVIAAIWSDDMSGGAAKADAVFWILGVLGWLLVPILQRFGSAGAPPAAVGAPSPVRVLGELDGVELVASRDPVEGIHVEPPSAGERLVLRRRS